MNAFRTITFINYFFTKLIDNILIVSVLLIRLDQFFLYSTIYWKRERERDKRKTTQTQRGRHHTFSNKI